MTNQTNLEAALTHAGRGGRVLPLYGVYDGACVCGDPGCKSPGKHPLTDQGLKQATADTTQIEGWWADSPEANIGLRTGALPEGSGWVVLDVDPAHGGNESLAELTAEHGELPVTVEVITGGGGRHLLFAHPGVRVRNRQNLLPGLDVRGDGGYIVAVASLHVSGNRYVWRPGHSPDELKPSVLPQWLLLRMLGNPKPETSPPPAPHTASVAVAPPVSGGALGETKPATPIETALACLSRVGPSGNGWSACCPAHDDRNPSLSVSEGEDGRVLIYCHAGCAVTDIIEAMGLSMSDLQPAGSDKSPHSKPVIRILSAPEALTKHYFETVEQAVEDMVARLGAHTAAWLYEDAGGSPAGLILRWDKPEGKQIRPVSRAPEGWYFGAMPEGRPLYHLPSLKDAQRVYVCEGEKAAEAARALDYVATTSAGGSKAALKTDWSPLAGKDIVILPDHDEAGEDYALDVLTCLSKLSPPPLVRVVRLPGLPDHGDLADFINVKGGDTAAVRQELETRIANTKPENFAAVSVQAAAYVPFPVKILPEPIRGFIARVSRALGCEPSYVALPLLSALAGAIGNTRVIRLKMGWCEPAVVWTAIVGTSGTLKSPALDKALAPVRERQREAFRTYKEAKKRYHDEKLNYERYLRAWKKNPDMYAMVPGEPEVPVAERYVCDDTTVEALAVLLRDQPRGVLLVRDELAGWFACFDRYVQGGGGDVAKWLEMFGGRPLTVDRKTGDDKVIYVPRAAVSVTGGIQPETLRRALGNENRENGLAARLLFAFPPNRPKRWTEVEVSPSDVQALEAVFKALYRLKMDKADTDDPVPREIHLSQEARKAWIRFYNEHAQEQSALTGDLAAAWSKLEGYAARLALIIHLVRRIGYAGEQVPSLDVDADSIEAGVRLARWFGNEAKRVYARIGETESERENRQFAEKIKAMGGSVSVRDWQRKQSNKRAEDAKAELKSLEDAGYGTLVYPSQEGVGRPSSPVFTLHADIPISPDGDIMPAPLPEEGFVSVSDTSTAQ